MPAKSASRNKAVTIGGLVVILGGFLLLGYLPYHRQSRALQTEIRRRQDAIAQSAAQSARLQELTRRAQLLAMEVRPYERLVPENKDLGAFLGQLSAQLNSAGLTDTAVRALAPTVLGKCEQLPIEVRSAGNFEKAHDFLVRLETLPRTSSVSHLLVESDTSLSGKVTVELTLSIYNTKAN